ncbi:hypothetical protein K7432_013445 [Basidiobolus ranarum]|uniref:cellulase n=1 Tax=Basidiobolus ranarum TaxID=34480 RepID=A0ABR2VQS3_9FUNG
MENKQSYDVPGHHSPSLSYLGSHDSENEIDLSSTIGFKSSSQAPGVYRTRTLTYPEGDINSIQLEESVMTDLKDFTMEKREKDKKRKRKSSRRKSSSQKSQRSRRKPKAKPKKKGRQSSPTTKSISKSTDPSDASPTTTAPLKQKIPKGFARYQEYLNVSILFFEAQRSGSLPPNQRVQWRKSAHLEDGKKYDWDLSGGYYDAGDFIKFGLPGSYSMTMLSWSLIEYPTGFAKAKQLEYILEAIKWGLDYILKCHVERAKFVVQVGDPKSDHDYWGSPEDMPSSVDRPVYFVTPELPGTEPVLEAASALASGSIIFKKYGQSAYAAKLLEHAIQLYELGSNHRGKYQGSVDKQKKGMSLGVNEGYLSSSYDDELVWSNLWLYQATNDTKYLSRAKTSYAKFSLDRRIIGTFHSWDDKSVGSVLLLSLLTDDKQYSKAMDKYFAKVMKKKTPGGLLWLPESSSGSANL